MLKLKKDEAAEYPPISAREDGLHGTPGYLSSLIPVLISALVPSLWKMKWETTPLSRLETAPT